jgi:hypothetical protein
MNTYDKSKQKFFIRERQPSSPPRRINTRYKNDQAADFFRDRWPSETYSPVDFLRVTARAVTGEDGRFLEDEIDLCHVSYSQYESFRLKETAYKEQVNESPKLSAEKPCTPRGMPELNPIRPPRQPLRVRNTVTGHVFDWDPIFTLSKNDDLEVIA